MSVEIDILYEGELHCLATHVPSGKTLATDAPVDNGGKGETFSPTDLVATAFGCCIMTIMALVAKRSGVDLTGARVHVVKEMVNEPVRRIGLLKVTVTIPKGLRLSETERAKLERAAELCPVRQSLHSDVKLQIQYIYAE
ncbi:MAG: OsmC family protein [Candidatus Sumerlaeota bacterium]|nr:OsmC family protein [Candidatus Sumerlaeota bacterium]